VTDDAEVTPEPPEAPPSVSEARPDAAEYDSERAVAARARGLAAPYIPGGRDPEPEAGLEEERKYTRLLLIMVGVIIIGGFVLGVAVNIINAIGGG
jgi:hypothetical protein